MGQTRRTGALIVILVKLFFTRGINRNCVGKLIVIEILNFFFQNINKSSFLFILRNVYSNSCTSKILPKQISIAPREYYTIMTYLGAGFEDLVVLCSNVRLSLVSNPLMVICFRYL